MDLRKNLIAVSVIAASTTLAGCGDSDDVSSNDNNTDNSVTAQGRITGFGSIYVSGVRYDTSDANFIVDGQPGNESDLELGKLVTVTGTATNNEGIATSVYFDDDVDGIISEVSLNQKGVGTIKVMGKEVTVDENTLIEFYTTAINTLDEAIYNTSTGVQYIAEVSGYSNGLGNVHASRIEIKSFDPLVHQLEIKGYVTDLSESTNSFMIGEMNIVYGNTTIFDDMTSATLENGLHVEAKGLSFDAQGSLIADEIENETSSGILSGNSDDEYEIEGVVGTVSSESFTLNGLTVHYDQSTLGTNLLVENAIVEVDAYRDSQSRLFADEIERDELDDDYHNGIELKGVVQNYDLTNNTIEVMGNTFQITTSTMIKDEYSQIRYFSLSDISWTAGNHYVEIKAYHDNSGNLLVSKLKYQGISNNETDELEGTLIVDQSGTNVMGIAVDFGSLTPPASGTRVEMEGTYSSGVFTATSLEAEPVDISSSNSNSSS